MEYKEECGCKVVSVLLRRNIIEYCPLHKSAPDLYEALKGMLKGYDPEEHWNNAIGKGLKALAKAEGK